MSPNPALLTWPRPVASSAWTPTDLGASLYAWFDASDAATITASGGRVSQWKDKSGAARHVAQDTGSQQPYTGARSQNGLNALDFRQISNDSYNSLRNGSVTLPQPFTIALVAAYDAWPSASAGIILATRSAGGYAPYSSGAALALRINSGTALISSTNPGTAPAVLVSIHNGASSAIRRNGSSIASGNAGTSAGEVVLIGTALSTSGGGYGFDGALGEIVITSGVLSCGDLTSLESYLATKWGI